MFSHASTYVPSAAIPADRIHDATLVRPVPVFWLRTADLLPGRPWRGFSTPRDYALHHVKAWFALCRRHDRRFDAITFDVFAGEAQEPGRPIGADFAVALVPYVNGRPLPGRDALERHRRHFDRYMDMPGVIGAGTGVIAPLGLVPELRREGGAVRRYAHSAVFFRYASRLWRALGRGKALGSDPYLALLKPRAA
jgi:hypothetical protein